MWSNRVIHDQYSTHQMHGWTYSRVCGKIIAYHLDALRQHLAVSVASLEGFYVDGISLTHGAPGSRSHIWTYAVVSRSSLVGCASSVQNHGGVLNW